MVVYCHDGNYNSSNTSYEKRNIIQVHDNVTWVSSEMTLNYWMMLERYSNLKEEIGGLVPGCEISSLLERKLARWSFASCALALACDDFL